MGKFHKKTCAILGVLILLLAAIFACYSKETTDICVTETARIYSSDDIRYAESHCVVIHGEYRKSLFSNVFTGEVVFGEKDIFDTSGKTLRLEFHNNIAKAVLSDPSGYIYPSIFCSVILNAKHDGMVIVLYSEYSMVNNQVKALFDEDHAKFICIGAVTREEAIALMRENSSGLN